MDPRPHFLSRRRASLRKNRFPRNEEARGEVEEGARAGGARRGQGAGRLSLGPPRPWGAPGPPPAPGLELCSFPPNYLSEPRAGGSPKDGPQLPEGLPINIRGSRPRLPASLPPRLSSPLFLFCCLYSWTRHSLGCLPPPTRELAVWTHSEHSKLSPSEVRPGRGEPPPPRRAPRGARVKLTLNICWEN